MQFIQKYYWSGVAIAFALALLFPPWLLIEQMGNGLFSNGTTIERRMALGSAFIATPPKPDLGPDYAEASSSLGRMGHMKLDVQINWKQQGVRLLGMLALAAIGFGLLRFGPWSSHTKPPSKEES